MEKSEENGEGSGYTTPVQSETSSASIPVPQDASTAPQAANGEATASEQTEEKSANKVTVKQTLNYFILFNLFANVSCKINL